MPEVNLARLARLARLAYTSIGDCLRHTQDAISRLQDHAAGTPLNLLLDSIRKELRDLQNGSALSEIAREGLEVSHAKSDARYGC